MTKPGEFSMGFRKLGIRPGPSDMLLKKKKLKTPALPTAHDIGRNVIKGKKMDPWTVGKRHGWNKARKTRHKLSQ